MSEVGIRALKQNASAVVAQAAAGEVITITDRGRPVAQLGPLSASRLDQLIATGLARAPSRDIRSLPVPKPGPPLSQLLIEARDDERF